MPLFFQGAFVVLPEKIWNCGTIGIVDSLQDVCQPRPSNRQALLPVAHVRLLVDIVDIHIRLFRVGIAGTDGLTVLVPEYEWSITHRQRFIGRVLFPALAAGVRLNDLAKFSEGLAVILRDRHPQSAKEEIGETWAWRSILEFGMIDQQDEVSIAVFDLHGWSAA